MSYITSKDTSNPFTELTPIQFPAPSPGIEEMSLSLITLGRRAAIQSQRLKRLSNAINKL